MNNKKTAFLSNIANPRNQAIVILALLIIFLFAGKLLSFLGIYQVDELYSWTCSTSLLLVFVMLNSLQSIPASDLDKYWKVSILYFLGIASIGGLLAYLVSGISILEAKTFAWIHVVVFVGYIVFLTIIRMTRSLINYAENEEWEQAKLHKRKGKSN